MIAQAPKRAKDPSKVPLHEIAGQIGEGIENLSVDKLDVDVNAERFKRPLIIHVTPPIAMGHLIVCAQEFAG